MSAGVITSAQVHLLLAKLRELPTHVHAFPSDKNSVGSVMNHDHGPEVV